MVTVFLADGCEEIEALMPVDYLRRAKIEVCTVGIAGRRVLGSHGIVLEADCGPENFSLSPKTEMIFLPGGSLGTQHLSESALVHKALSELAARDGWLCAICAAPTVLAEQGYLDGKKATCYPGCEEKFGPAVTYTGNAIERDGHCITGRSAGCAGSFACELISALRGKEVSDKIRRTLYPDW